MANEICGACEKEYANYQKYLDHTCEKTGFNPKEVEHQDALTDGQFSLQSATALERGAARKAAA